MYQRDAESGRVSLFTRPVTEKQLQKAVIEIIHLHGYVVAHFAASAARPGRFVTNVVADGAGFPDLVVCGHGRILFVELKQDGRYLKPNQKVRMILTDDKATIRFGAIVAWASFEIPPKDGPRYRAGIEFIDADAEALEAFCIRHKQA